MNELNEQERKIPIESRASLLMLPGQSAIGIKTESGALIVLSAGCFEDLLIKGPQALDLVRTPDYPADTQDFGGVLDWMVMTTAALPQERLN